MKNKILGILILSTVLILSGCRSSRSLQESSMIVQSSSVVETERTSPEPDTETITEAPTDPRELYRREKTVTYLNSFQKIFSDFDYNTEIVSMGGGKAAFLFNSVEADKISTRIVVIDLIKDKVVSDRSFDSYIIMYGSTDKGLVVYNTDKNRFKFYSDELEETDLFEFDNYYGSFSSDGEKYYCVISKKLYCVNTKNGDFTRINTPDEIEFQPCSCGISVDNKYIALNEANYEEAYNHPLILVDLESGELEMLNIDVANPSFGKHGAFFTNKDYESTETYIDYVNESGKSVRLSYSPEKEYYSVLQNSDFIYNTSYDGVNETLVLGRSDNNGNFEFGEVTLNGAMLNTAYMREEELILSIVSTDDIFKIALIEPELIEFDEVRECDDAPSPIYFDNDLLEEIKSLEVSIPEVRDDLKPLKERADKLERKFGVEIYISNECLGVSNSTGYNCTNDDYDPDYEYDLIADSLNELNYTLEKYPKGYFRQFKNIIGEEGIYIAFVSHINDDFSAAYSYYDGDTYYIVMDISYGIDMNFGHEMWHSTESYICRHRPDLLKDEDWEKLNPEGFFYTSYEDYDESDYQYTYIGEYENTEECDWYFYDSYGKVNTLEDKAKIMEVAMAPEYYNPDDFFRSPHIMEKFNVMCNAIRETFDTTGWQDVFWEKYNYR